MEPGHPLVNPAENYDDPFKAEHSLQIRIDDVPSYQVEIANVYAAEVRYVGPRVPPIPPNTCRDQASAVFDAQDAVDKVQNDICELEMGLGDLNMDDVKEHKESIKYLNSFVLPAKYSDLSTAKFNYAVCAGVDFWSKPPPSPREAPIIHVNSLGGDPLYAHVGTKEISDTIQIQTRNLAPPLQIDWLVDRQLYTHTRSESMFEGRVVANLVISLSCGIGTDDHNVPHQITVNITDANGVSGTGGMTVAVFVRKVVVDEDNPPPPIYCKRKPWLPECTPDPDD